MGDFARMAQQSMPGAKTQWRSASCAVP